MTSPALVFFFLKERDVYSRSLTWGYGWEHASSRPVSLLRHFCRFDQCNTHPSKHRKRCNITILVSEPTEHTGNTDRQGYSSRQSPDLVTVDYTEECLLEWREVLWKQTSDEQHSFKCTVTTFGFLTSNYKHHYTPDLFRSALHSCLFVSASCLHKVCFTCKRKHKQTK